jgi:hypothetical protein
MLAHKARVENGRLKLDEPTNLPDGTVIELVAASEFGELSDEERLLLHASLRRGIDDAKAGRLVDADQVIDELFANP